MGFGVPINWFFWLRKVSKNLLSAKDDVIRLNVLKANRILQGVPEDPFEEFEEKRRRKEGAGEPTLADPCSRESNGDSEPPVPQGPTRCPFEIVSGTATVPGLLRLGLTVLRGGRLSVSSVRIVLRVVSMTATQHAGAPSAAHRPTASTTTPQNATPTPTEASVAPDQDRGAGVSALLHQLLLPMVDALLNARLTSATELDIDELIVVLQPPLESPFANGERVPQHVVELHLRCRHIRFSIQGHGEAPRELVGDISVESVHAEWCHSSNRPTHSGCVGDTAPELAQMLCRCCGLARDAPSPRHETPVACTAAFRWDTAGGVAALSRVTCTVHVAPIEVVLTASDLVALTRLVRHVDALGRAPSSTTPTTAVPRGVAPAPPPSSPCAQGVGGFGHAQGVRVTLLLEPLSKVPQHDPNAPGELPSLFWGAARDASTCRHVEATWHTGPVGSCREVPEPGVLPSDPPTPVSCVVMTVDHIRAALPSCLDKRDVNSVLRAHGESRLCGRWEPVVETLGSPAITAALGESDSEAIASPHCRRVALLAVGALRVRTFYRRPAGVGTDSVADAHATTPAASPPKECAVPHWRDVLVAKREPCALLIVHRCVFLSPADDTTRLAETLVAVTAKTAVCLDSGSLVRLDAFTRSVMARTPTPAEFSPPPGLEVLPSAASPPAGDQTAGACCRIACLAHGLDVTLTLVSEACHRHAGPLRFEVMNLRTRRENVGTRPVTQGTAMSLPPWRVEWKDMRVLFQAPTAGTDDPQTWAMFLQCPGGPKTFIEVGTRGDGATAARSFSMALDRVLVGPLTMAFFHRLVGWTAEATALLVRLTRGQTNAPSHEPLRSEGSARRARGTTTAAYSPRSHELASCLLAAPDVVTTSFDLCVRELAVELLAPRLAWDGTAYGAPAVYDVFPTTANAKNNHGDNMMKLFHHYACTVNGVVLQQSARSSTWCQLHPFNHNGGGTSSTTALHGGCVEEMYLQVAGFSLVENLPAPLRGGEHVGDRTERVCIVESHTGAAPTGDWCEPPQAAVRQLLLEVRRLTTRATLSHGSQSPSCGHAHATFAVSHEHVKARLSRLCLYHLVAHLGDAWFAVLAHFFTVPPCLRVRDPRHTSTTTMGSGESEMRELRATHRRVELHLENLLWSSLPPRGETTCAGGSSPGSSRNAPSQPALFALVSSLHAAVQQDDDVHGRCTRASAAFHHPAYAFISTSALPQRTALARCLARAQVWGRALEGAGCQRLAELVRSDKSPSGGHQCVVEVLPSTASCAFGSTTVHLTHLHAAVFITPMSLRALASVVARFSAATADEHCPHPATLVAGGGPRFTWVPAQARQLAAPMSVTVNPFLAARIAGGAEGSLEESPTREPNAPQPPSTGSNKVDLNPYADLTAYRNHALNLLSGRPWRERVAVRAVSSTDGHTYDFSEGFSLPLDTPQADLRASGACSSPGKPQSSSRGRATAGQSFGSINLSDLDDAADAWITGGCVPADPLDALYGRRPHYLSVLSQQAAATDKWSRSEHLAPSARTSAAEPDAATFSFHVVHCPAHVVVYHAEPCATDNADHAGKPIGHVSSPSIGTLLAHLRRRRAAHVPPRPPPVPASPHGEAPTTSLACLLLEVRGLCATLKVLPGDGADEHGVRRCLSLQVSRLAVHDFSSESYLPSLLLAPTPALPADWQQPAPFLRVEWLTAHRPRHALTSRQAAASIAQEEDVSVHVQPITLRISDGALRFVKAFTAAMGSEGEQSSAEPAACSDAVALPQAPTLFFRSFTLARTVVTIASTEACDRVLAQWILPSAWHATTAAATLPLGLFLRLDGVEVRVPYVSLHHADGPLLARKLTHALEVAISEQLRSLAEQLVRPVRSASAVGSAALRLVRAVSHTHSSFPVRRYNTTRAGMTLWHVSRSQIFAGVSLVSRTAAQCAQAVADYFLLPSRDTSAPAVASNTTDTRSPTYNDSGTNTLAARLTEARTVLGDANQGVFARVPAATLLLWVGIFEEIASAAEPPPGETYHSYSMLTTGGTASAERTGTR